MIRTVDAVTDNDRSIDQESQSCADLRPTLYKEASQEYGSLHRPAPRSKVFATSSDQQGSILACFLRFSTVKEFMSDLDVQLPTAFDPFAEANADDSGAGAKEYVHVRVQQRNGRKSLTTVQGLKKEFSYNKILKDLKKEFCCNGTVVQDPELGQVIQLQGDQRKNVSNFLSQTGIVKKEHIKIHGF
ncbi:Protein translation factor SUI1 [Musa troglodytarum]|uniref:Protein translation factor SUI1 homolog n=1 Tax=Musa troglodytarum TaxID=320322 RepID=A0A9E7HIK9_9LILI|nr:Protein translation factor SUI1 [Musa troglodytarum]